MNPWASHKNSIVPEAKWHFFMFLITIIKHFSYPESSCAWNVNHTLFLLQYLLWRKWERETIEPVECQNCWLVGWVQRNRSCSWSDIKHCAGSVNDICWQTGCVYFSDISLLGIWKIIFNKKCIKCLWNEWETIKVQ